MSKKTFELPNSPKPAGPYSQAVIVERPLFLAGIVAFRQNEDTSDWENLSDQMTLAQETLQSIDNLKRALGDLSLELDDVADVTAIVRDITDERFDEVNEAYALGFEGVEDYPTRACFGGIPPRGYKVELKAVVELPSDYVIPTR